MIAFSSLFALLFSGANVYAVTNFKTTNSFTKVGSVSNISSKNIFSTKTVIDKNVGKFAFSNSPVLNKEILTLKPITASNAGKVLKTWTVTDNFKKNFVVKPEGSNFDALVLKLDQKGLKEALLKTNNLKKAYNQYKNKGLGTLEIETPKLQRLPDRLVFTTKSKIKFKTKQEFDNIQKYYSLDKNDIYQALTNKVKLKNKNLVAKSDNFKLEDFYREFYSKCMADNSCKSKLLKKLPKKTYYKTRPYSSSDNDAIRDFFFDDGEESEIVTEEKIEISLNYNGTIVPGKTPGIDTGNIGNIGKKPGKVEGGNIGKLPSFNPGKVDIPSKTPGQGDIGDNPSDEYPGVEWTPDPNSDEVDNDFGNVEEEDIEEFLEDSDGVNEEMQDLSNDIESKAEEKINKYLQAANNLASAGVINNHREDPVNYNFSNTILRNEAAKIAVNLDSSVSPKTKCDNEFFDVGATKPNNWTCSYVEALRDAGKLSKNKRFNLLSRLTKAEATKMMLEAAGCKNVYTHAEFWQAEVAGFASSNGLIPMFTDYNTKASRAFVFAIADGARQFCSK